MEVHELTQAQAARSLAESTAKRWKEMLAGKTVSAQESDEKAGDLALKRATADAAQAKVQRFPAHPPTYACRATPRPASQSDCFPQMPGDLLGSGG